MFTKKDKVTKKEVHAFIDAAKFGRWDDVEAWLLRSPEHRSHVNDMPAGRWSALHHAARLGSIKATKMLLRFGANPNLLNRDGRTPAGVSFNPNPFLIKLLRASKTTKAEPPSVDGASKTTASANSQVDSGDSDSDDSDSDAPFALAVASAFPTTRMTRLSKLKIFISNTATSDLVNGKWEWRVFLIPGNSDIVESVRMSRSDGSGAYMSELEKTEREPEMGAQRWVLFKSKKMKDLKPFEVCLNMRIRGILDPVKLQYTPSFVTGGAREEREINLDEIREERFKRAQAILGSKGSAANDVTIKDIAARTPLVPGTKRGVTTDDSNDIAATERDKGDQDHPLFDTRASLEAKIERYTKEIRSLEGDKDVTIEMLLDAEKAQSALERLIPLRETLPDVKQLQAQLAELEAERDSLIQDAQYSRAVVLQTTIDKVKGLIEKEEEENAVEKGRLIMQRAMENDLAPEPIPYGYLQDSTDDFSDERQLGEGAFSNVYMGKDLILRRKFAVKQLRIKVHADTSLEEAKKTFERELMALKHFRHPNIARLYAYCLSPNLRGHQCLVFELAANGSLASFLSRKGEKLHWTTRISIALDVARALEYLHKGNAGQICFHRDVKASNICLRRNFSALLIDCGVSKMMPENESDSTLTIMETYGDGLRGTRGYICPMFAHSMKGYTSANEVFSLGIVFAELFTGKLQNSRDDGDEVDLFNLYSEDGAERKNLSDYEDQSADNWDIDLRCDFAHLSVECISLNPAKRPKIGDIVQRLGTFASRARGWVPGERNQIKVLTSDPLVWSDMDGNLHPVTSILDFASERDLLIQCMKETERDIKLSFDIASDDRLHAATTRRCGCLHFSGHGHPNYLLFEDGHGGAHALGENELFDQVHLEPFKFVFVSACYSALMGKALVRAGVPHVVCCNHQEALRDDAALKFTYAFYFSLAHGYTVKAAFEKGRQAVSKRFDEQEVDKFLLLPEDGDHDDPIFDAEVLEWNDDPGQENFIPSPPMPFIRRELDMYFLLQKILSHRLVTLVGDQGSGCSSMVSAVSQYVRQRRTTMLNICDIYFIRGDKNMCTSTMDSFILPLHAQLVAEGKAPNLKGSPSNEDVCRIICETLAEKRALVVFDGVDSKDAALKDFLYFLFKSTNSVKLLVAARAPIGFSTSNVEESVCHLRPLDFESTALLFSKVCPHADTPQKQQALRVVILDKSSSGREDSDEQRRALYEKLGGGLPSLTIHAAKAITRKEFDSLIDTNPSE